MASCLMYFTNVRLWYGEKQALRGKNFCISTRLTNKITQTGAPIRVDNSLECFPALSRNRPHIRVKICSRRDMGGSNQGR